MFLHASSIDLKSGIKGRFGDIMAMGKSITTNLPKLPLHLDSVIPSAVFMDSTLLQMPFPAALPDFWLKRTNNKNTNLNEWKALSVTSKAPLTQWVQAHCISLMSLTEMLWVEEPTSLSYLDFYTLVFHCASTGVLNTFDCKSQVVMKLAFILESWLHVLFVLLKVFNHSSSP